MSTRSLSGPAKKVAMQQVASKEEVERHSKGRCGDSAQDGDSILRLAATPRSRLKGTEAAFKAKRALYHGFLLFLLAFIAFFNKHAIKMI